MNGDEAKNLANHKKHRVWFEEAQSISADPVAVEFFDPEHSRAEDRFIRVGVSTASRTILVVVCEYDAGRRARIISARKAPSKERKQYEEGV